MQRDIEGERILPGLVLSESVFVSLLLRLLALPQGHLEAAFIIIIHYSSMEEVIQVLYILIYLRLI